MRKRTRVLSARCAYLGGVLLIISGYAAHNELLEYILAMLASIEYLGVIAGVLLFFITLLGALGGITVIAGGFAVAKNHLKIGKFLISTGSGFGLIELCIYLFSKYGGNAVTGFELFIGSFSGIGIMLSIISRAVLRDFL